MNQIELERKSTVCEGLGRVVMSKTFLERCNSLDLRRGRYRPLLNLYRRLLSCKSNVMTLMVGTNDDDDSAEVMRTTTSMMMATLLRKMKRKKVKTEGEREREGGRGLKQEKLQLEQASCRDWVALCYPKHRHPHTVNYSQLPPHVKQRVDEASNGPDQLKAKLAARTERPWSRLHLLCACASIYQFVCIYVCMCVYIYIIITIVIYTSINQ